MNSIDILDELKHNFIDSSYETNCNRAFPNINDGLKPGQRCCLWEMYVKGYTSSKPHVKSAKISGAVTGTWHPHGDVAIYETFARMSMPYINNFPEVDFHGSNGNQIFGSDDIAAARYSESRLSKISEDGMLKGINKNNVDMVLNYTEDEKMPKVLPAIFPRLLVNGAMGIGVGIANTWVPHSLKDTAEIIFDYIKNGHFDSSGYFPDLPTGGEIINKDELDLINKTGKGRVVVQAKYRINGKEIEFYEMPYQVYIEPVIEKIKDGIEKNKISSVKSVSNKSDKKRILLSVTSSSDVELTLKELFDNTPLRTQIDVNQVGIISKTPQLYTLKQVVEQYVKHNSECIRREYDYDLQKALERIHILEGLIIAISDIDKTIKIIKESEDPEAELVKEYSLDHEQASAILAMKLRSISKLETESLKEELESKRKLADDCRKIVDNPEEQKKVLMNRLQELVDKYGEKTRRTKISQKTFSKTAKGSAKPAKKEAIDIVAAVNTDGYVKSIPIGSYKKSLSNIIEVKTNTDDIMTVYMSSGKAFRVAMKNIKTCSSADKGTAIGSMVNSENGDKVLLADLNNATIVNDYAIFISSDGKVKKANQFEYIGSTQNIRGYSYMKLADGCSVVYAGFGNENDFVNLKTKNGFQISFSIDELNVQGKGAGGVKGISLQDGDYVVSASVGKAATTPKHRGGRGAK